MLALSLALAACSPSRLIESSRILHDIEAGEGPSRLKETTPPPNCRTMTYRFDGPERIADLYMPGPGQEARAGVVLVPGASASGKDDARLIAFATSLARGRFAVLVPDIPGLRSLRVRADDAEYVGDGLIALSRHRAVAAGNRTVGIVAVSYAAGPATLALLDPRTHDTAQFMLTIGGLYDIEAVITFFTTGYFRDSGTAAWRHREPNEYGKWIFAISNSDFLDDPSDRALVEEMARRRLDMPGADIADLAAGLGPQGQAIYRLLVNRDPERVPALIAALPDRVRDEITRFDLSGRDLTNLGVRFVLIHGHDDPIIPETESIAFAAAVPSADLYVLDSLQHVDPKPSGPVDQLRMLSAMSSVLAERDRKRAPVGPLAEDPLAGPGVSCRP